MVTTGEIKNPLLRSESIRLRLRPHEFAAARRAATQEHLTLSELIRAALMAHLSRVLKKGRSGDE